jgi:hypothetical protein
MADVKIKEWAYWAATDPAFRWGATAAGLVGLAGFLALDSCNYLAGVVETFPNGNEAAVTATAELTGAIGAALLACGAAIKSSDHA